VESRNLLLMGVNRWKFCTALHICTCL